jgi:RNA polymerase sigma factor (sigma-70 family)
VLDVESLYRKYGPMVLRRCRHLLRDEEKAADAMQETFVRLLRSRDRLTDAAPSSLLYCIATNVCLNVIRSERGRFASCGDELLELMAGKDDVAAMGEAKGLIEALFESEEESTRTMAVLHYVDGLTFEETASRVGLSVSGVRKRLAGLRERAARFMKEGK